jgi:enamine deaminase RidA (YjgF/YER057c/UK114 family)
MRERFRSGGAFEEVAAYSRAARHGSRIVVSGTADIGPDGSAVHPGDAYAQTKAALERSLDAVAALGGRKEDVILTRVLLVEGADWRRAVEAHREIFGGIDPANTTLFVAGLIPEGALVEVEVEAEVVEPDPR